MTVTGILITGGTGRLGKDLVKVFPNSLAPSHLQLDITNARSVDQFFQTYNFETIIHCAAVTSIRQCEANKELAYTTNVKGTENLVNACVKWKPKAYFIYVSTACVFHGDRGNYNEDDTPNPKNFYGLTKLLGEFVAKKAINHLIIRTNFVERSKWPYPQAFTDRLGTYLFSDDLARAIKETIRTKPTGVIHIVGDKAYTMYEIAMITTPEVKPITMKDVDVPVTQNMTLQTKKIKPFKITI